MYSLWQDLSSSTNIFDLVTLTVNFDLYLENFNLGHNFWTITGRAFIFLMCIPCDKTFSTVPKVLTSWPCLWPLTYIYKTLTLVITFELFEIGPLYFTCVFLITIPFNWYQTFHLLTFTVTFDLYLENLNLSQNFKTVTGRAFIFLMCIACAKTFPMVPKVLTLWPCLWPLTYI